MLTTIIAYIVIIGWLGTGLLFLFLGALGIIEMARKGVRWIGGERA